MTKNISLLVIGNDLDTDTAVLKRTNENIHLLDHVYYGFDGLQTCHEMTPDVILLNARLPDMDSSEVVRVIRSLYPTIRIIGFSVTFHEDEVRSLLAAGAGSFVLTRTMKDALAPTIRSVYDGKSVFSPEISQRLLTRN